ncbi:MAG TPA: HAD family phosphatase [Verrucomicrobiae bacterium]
MKKPEAVVFDLGKVLLDFDYARFANNVLTKCGVPAEEILNAVNQSELLVRYETGLLTSQEFFNQVKGACSYTGHYDEFEPVFGDIFSEIPAMIALHARLRDSGIPTYIFSNTSEIVIKHIRKTYPFFNTFTDYVLSYEHRSVKPQPRIYEVVEARSGRKGEQLLYIDDRLENVEHGRERGWQVIHHVNTPETVRKVEKLLLS